MSKKVKSRHPVPVDGRRRSQALSPATVLPVVSLARSGRLPIDPTKNMEGDKIEDATEGLFY
jgi:hypothetical protein